MNKITRRRVLTSSIAALPLSPMSAFASNIKNDVDLHKIHEKIAAKAKAIKKTEVMRLLLPSGCEKNVLPVVNMFYDLTGITIEIKQAPVHDINTLMHLSASKGTTDFDLSLPSTFAIPDLAESKAIVDLSHLRNQYEPKGFNDDVLYPLGDFYKNRFYGYQTDGDAYLMFYNLRLLTEDRKKEYEDTFGNTYKIPTTWEDLDTQLAFFHRPDKNEYGGALFRNIDYLSWEWWLRFHAKGKLPLNDQLIPQIDSDEGIAALEEVIRASENLYPSAYTDGLIDNWEAYAKGNIYANMGWGGTQKYLIRKSKTLTHMEYSPPPGGKAGANVPFFNWGWNYTVSANSKHIELAYLFSLFASCPLLSLISVRQSEGFFDPHRSQHYQDPLIQSTYSEKFLSAHKASMKNCIPDFYINGRSKYFSSFKKYIWLAVNREQTPEKAMKNISLNWRRLNNRIGNESQKEQWLFLKSQYPQNLRLS